jgi:hypothetical protein
MLRNWHRQGPLKTVVRIADGRRRYRRDAACARVACELAIVRKTICYARVSSRDPVEQPGMQIARLQQHCLDAGFADIYQLFLGLSVGLGAPFIPAWLNAVVSDDSCDASIQCAGFSCLHQEQRWGAPDPYKARIASR